MVEKHKRRNRLSGMLSGLADSVAVAIEASNLASQSDAYFQVRGTTRDRAIRKLFDI